MLEKWHNFVMEESPGGVMEKGQRDCEGVVKEDGVMGDGVS